VVRDGHPFFLAALGSYAIYYTCELGEIIMAAARKFKTAMLMAAVLIGTVQPLCAEATTERTPISLAASGKWVIDYQLNSCRMLRNFGDGDNIVTLAFQKNDLDQYFTLYAVGLPLKANSKLKEGALKFGSEKAFEKVSYFVAETDTKLPVLIFAQNLQIAPVQNTVAEHIGPDTPNDMPSIPAPAPISEERLDQVKTLFLDASIAKPLILETGSLKKPFAALDKCFDDLVATYGLDPAKLRTAKRQVTPKNSPISWLDSNDYPRAMLAANQQGAISAHLLVDRNGKVTACKIVNSTSAKEFEKEFNDTVCRGLIRRARFHPAIDAQGQAMASFWNAEIQFKIP
jgi:hypothetical protein